MLRRAWNHWQQSKTTRRLAGGVVLVAALTVLVKLAATGKEMLVAKWFGATAELDVYLLALQVALYVASVVGGSMSVAFVPAYLQVREQQGPLEAQRLLSSVVLLVGCGAAALAILLAAGSDLVVRFVDRGAGRVPDGAIVVFWIVAAIPIVAGVAAVWGAALNGHERFALVAAAPIAVPLVTIGVLIPFAERWGIRALAIGTASGFAVEMLLVGYGLRREKMSVAPRWGGWTPPLRQVGGQYLPVVVGAMLMNANPLIDQSIAAALGAPGSVAALNYGNKVVAVAQGLLAVSLGTILLPHFSRQIAAGNWPAAERSWKTATLIVLAVTIPATLAAVWFSEPLARLLYERGAFTPDKTRLVGQIQACYLLQAPCYVTGILGARLLSALEGNRALLAVSCLNVVINFVADVWLMQRIGVPGIALATSLVYLVSSVVLYALAARRLRQRARLAMRDGTSGTA